MHHGDAGPGKRIGIGGSRSWWWDEVSGGGTFVFPPPPLNMLKNTERVQPNLSLLRREDQRTPISDLLGESSSATHYPFFC